MLIVNSTARIPPATSALANGSANSGRRTRTIATSPSASIPETIFSRSLTWFS